MSDLANSLTGLQPVLDNVYNEMLPQCGKLISVASSLAGFGALWYIAVRVWRQIAAAEPIDFFPLLRPFALGLAILLFQSVVIPVMNGVLQPIVSATGDMVKSSNTAVAQLLKQKEDAIKHSDAYQMYEGADGNGDADKYYKYTHPDDPDHTNEGTFEAIGNDVKFWLAKQNYAFKNSIKLWLSEVLEVVYAASSLCINTLRTFFLIVLAIIGPLVLGFSVFDGLQNSLVQWLARYINVFLWLPVANIFGSIIGKVQEKMLALDIAQIKAQGDTFFSSTDTAYCIFLLIGIVGYFSVPTVAGYIVHAHGGNGMLQRISSLTASGANIVTNTATNAGGAAASRMGRGLTNIASAPKHFMSGYNGGGNSSSGQTNYQANKLKGDKN